MKIAFLNLYSGINHRGAEAFAHELGNRLLANHEVVFFQAGARTQSQRMPVVRVETQMHQPLSTFPAPLLPAIAKRAFLDPASRSVLRFTKQLLQPVVRGGFAVVIPLNGFWQLLLLHLARFWGNYRILVIGNAGPGWDERWNLYLRPDVFVATTQPAYEWARRTCPWTRVELIPYAIDAETFIKSPPAMLPLRRPIILCPAALVPYKRIELAIEAASRMKDVSLLVLGRGQLEDQLRSMGKRLLADRFLLTSVPPQRMPAYYRAVDLVTLPSAPQENSPMVFLESLAAGKPVVTTDSARHRWLLEQAAVFCDPEDQKVYAEALRRALLTPQRTQTKRQTQALIKFLWPTVLSRYEDILHSIAR